MAGLGDALLAGLGVTGLIQSSTATALIVAPVRERPRASPDPRPAERLGDARRQHRILFSTHNLICQGLDLVVDQDIGRRLEILADGLRMECHSLFVCNAAKYGGKFLLAPQADIFSPEFQVVCIKSDARSALLKLALKTVLGKTGDTRDIRRFATSELVITGSKAVQVDGDFCCYSPVKIQAVPGFARLIV